MPAKQSAASRHEEESDPKLGAPPGRVEADNLIAPEQTSAAFSVTTGSSRRSTARPARGVLGLQCGAGNAATTRMLAGRPGAPLAVQRLQHADFPGPVGKLSDFELMRAHRFDGEGDVMGVGLSDADRGAVRAEMRRRGLRPDGPGAASGPLDAHRELMPTSGGVATEVAKPGLVGAGAGVGYLEATAHDPTAASTFGGATTGSSVASGVIGGALLLDAGMTMAAGYSAREAARKRGDRAGERLGGRKMKQAGWGIAAGAVGATAAGLKIGGAFGSTAAGLVSATGALGMIGGAVTVGQGAWRLYMAHKRIASLDAFTPATDQGRIWKQHIKGREVRKAGVNALKIAAGALGIAAGALLLVSNPAGWAVGIAGLALGGALAAGKIFNKVNDMRKNRNAKKEMEKEGKFDALVRPQSDVQKKNDPDRRKQVHGLANEVAQRNSENARVAGGMIGALERGDERVLGAAVEPRDRTFPADSEFVRTRQYLQNRPRNKMELGQEELRRHDAELLLGAINVKREDALSESGHDLVQRKLSVAESA